jgi:hypothetical protein
MGREQGATSGVVAGRALAKMAQSDAAILNKTLPIKAKSRQP